VADPRWCGRVHRDHLAERAGLRPASREFRTAPAIGRPARSARCLAGYWRYDHRRVWQFAGLLRSRTGFGGSTSAASSPWPVCRP